MPSRSGKILVWFLGMWVLTSLKRMCSIYSFDKASSFKRAAQVQALRFEGICWTSDYDMSSFSKLRKVALLVVACASLGYADPLASATRRSIPISENLQIEAFHPISTFEVCYFAFVILGFISEWPVDIQWRDWSSSVEAVEIWPEKRLCRVYICSSFGEC